MPPSVVQSISSASRRSTGPNRQRENRPYNQQGSTSVRRRKSRSPDTRAGDDATLQSDSHTRRKKRPMTIAGAGAPSSSGATNAPGGTRMVVYEDPVHVGERGRVKAKPKSRPTTVWVDDEVDDAHIVTNIVSDLGQMNAAPQSARSKRKERSRSREAQRLARKTVTPEPMAEDDETMYTGPLAQAEYARMRQELEILRKQVAANKKSMKAQAKNIDELRNEVASAKETHRTQTVEIEKLKKHSRKTDDLVATFETNLTCQICMELLLKPYGLSPCGHVLCVTCLLEWFKAAPANEDDMIDDDHPNALLYRTKNCPCCRAVVRSKPIQLYLIKSLASSLDKAKAPPGAARPSPPPDDEDPWAGIFRDPNLDAYWSTDDDEEDDEDDEDEDEGGEGEEYDEEYDYHDGYGSGEDEEHYEGPYVNPRWAPPFTHVTPEDYSFLDDDSEELSMLRRGATMAMIELFHMSYDHETGLCAIVDEVHRVYLGWNIDLHPDDPTGEEFMNWIIDDRYDRPQRWRVLDGRDGSWTAWRLIPEYDDDEYDNTDSEYWVEEMAEDEDEDM